MTVETQAKWLLVLGANSDMALATAHRFAKAGYSIYLASRNLGECEKNAADLRLRYGVQAQVLAFDASDFASHSAFYAGLAVKPAGVVLAFGVMQDQAAAQADFALAQKMIEVNYAGAVSIFEIIAADFEARKSGFMVGISSVAGDRGRMSNYLYGSTKAALTAYLAGLRHRMSKSGVSVLTVKPGFVATKMTADLDLPAKLTAQPSEVAEAIFKAVQKRKATVYVKPIWWLIMQIIVHLPNFIFHKTKM
jgi:short-subunit dehydrogenase